MASTFEIEMNQYTPAAGTILTPALPKSGPRPSLLSGNAESQGGQGGDESEGRAEESSEASGQPSGPDAGGPLAAPTRTSLPEAWKPPSNEELLEQQKDLFTAEEKEKAWNEVTQTVKTYSDEMIERWNSEIDTYLVYAGLFSAIVTAFNVQSYLPLQQQPDPTLAAVMQISLQLSGLSINTPFVNSTHAPFGASDAARAGPAPGPPPGAATVALNTLWFSSLVLSLSSASIGIMVKQWLNEYKSGLSSGSQKTSRETPETRKSARLRQYRLNNLIKWRVDVVVLAIPVLLQLALVSFLAGLLVLAWTLHHTVAAITTIFVALLTIFTLATIVLPSVKSSCAYLSPQALLLDTIFQTMRYIFCRTLYDSASTIWAWAFRRLLRDYVALRRPIQLVECITRSVVDWCRWSSPDRTAPPRTWHTREKEDIAQSSDSLDSDLFAMAYDASLADPNILDAAARCLTDADKTTIIRAFDRLHAVAAKHFGPSYPAYDVVASARASSFVLWWNTALSVLLQPACASESTEGQLKHYLYCIWASASRQSLPTGAHANWILGVLSASIWNESSSSQTENGASDSVFRLYPGTMQTALRELDVDGQIGGKVLRHIAAAVHRRLWGQALNMSSEDEFCTSTDLVRILVRCRTRMMTAPDVSDDDRNTLCTYTEEALGEFQAALGKVDCNTVTWSHLEALRRLLRTLHEEHTPARPLIRMEFILAVRNFLSGVKSRSDLQSHAREEIESCETYLNVLELKIQSGNSLPPVTGLHSAAVRAVFSLQPSTPSHPIEEHVEHSSRSARSTPSDRDDSNPKPTSSQTGLTSCSSAAAAFASQSPLSHPVQEQTLEDGPADRVEPPARKDPAHFIAELSPPTFPAAISPRQVCEAQHAVQKQAESTRGHFDRANTAVPSNPGLPGSLSDAHFDSRSGAASTSQSHPLHHVQGQAEDVISSAAIPSPSDSVEPCEASKSDPPPSSGLAHGSSPAGISSKSRFAPAPPPDDEQKDNNLPSSPATVEQAWDTPHSQAMCTSASAESLPPPNSA